MPDFKHFITALLISNILLLSSMTTASPEFSDFEDLGQEDDIIVVDGQRFPPNQRVTRRQLGLYSGEDASSMLQEAFAQAGIDLGSSSSSSSSSSASSEADQSQMPAEPKKRTRFPALASRLRNLRLPQLPSLSSSLTSAFARRRAVTPMPGMINPMIIPIMGRPPPMISGGIPLLPASLPPPPPSNSPGGINTNGVLQVKGPAFVTTPYFTPNLPSVSKTIAQQSVKTSSSPGSDNNNDRSGLQHQMVLLSSPGMKSSASNSNHHYVIVKPTPLPLPSQPLSSSSSTHMTSRPHTSSPVSLAKPRFVKINLKTPFMTDNSWIPSSLTSYTGVTTSTGFKPIPTMIRMAPSSSSSSSSSSSESLSSSQGSVTVSVKNDKDKENETLSSSLTSSSSPSESTTNYKNSIKYYENLFSNFHEKNNWFKPIEKYKSQHWKVSHSVNETSPEESANDVIRSIMTANHLYSPSSSFSTSLSSSDLSPIRFKKPTTTMTSFTINPSALLQQISRVNTNRNSLSCKNKDLGWCDFSDSYPEHFVVAVIKECRDVIDRMYVEVPQNLADFDDYVPFSPITKDLGVKVSNHSSDTDSLSNNKEDGSIPESWSWAGYQNSNDHQSSSKHDNKKENKDNALCDSDRKFVRPSVAQDITGRWFVIVQSSLYHQQVPVELCRSPGGVCNNLSSCGLSARCVQKFNTQLLISIDLDKEQDCPSMRLYRFPSGCICDNASYY